MRPAPHQDRIGRFEGRRGELLVGWACDPFRPYWRAPLRLRADTGAAARILAECCRADVQAAGHGDGYAGFAVPLRHFPGARRFRCLWDDLGTDLPGSPTRLALRRPMATANDGMLRIAVDRPEPGDQRLTGWAIDLARPAHRPLLALSDGTRTLGEARACLYRPDLRSHGADGFHGFLFASGRPVRGQTVRLADAARRAILLEIIG